MHKQHKTWEITLSREQFKGLQKNERFWAVLTLARVVNALRFIQVAANSPESHDSPSVHRQIMNSCLFLGAVLYEGMAFAKSLGKHFKDMPAFSKDFGKLFEDPDVKKFHKRTLKKLRDKFVFHFDKDVAPGALRNLDLPQYVFISGRGNAVGEAYYWLADVASVNYLLDLDGDIHEKEFLTSLSALLQRITDLSKCFGIAADELIAAALESMASAMTLTYH